MTTIELPTHCDRKATAALLPELLDAVDAGPVRIDGAKVERMGMAMLQVLLAARRSAPALKLADPSGAMREALSLAGQQSLLDEGEGA
ncbi:STAS domain-containing protein [Aurantiacibacter poecillastricola]|uniref:STAS domain-containing protein n=1 Tax=Aurantiacibacter poecillastricola TaxID=3064385 RepID=UPI00273DA29C|nr:STAS domain-containing protein [Aurantiacibacter sp. 219JJ12-13]MDP5262388.1 STAS domain-containing protein [Aurantiacibacter sp. 219JJ12-13]